MHWACGWHWLGFSPARVARIEHSSSNRNTFFGGDGYGDGYGVQLQSNMMDELDLTEISGEIE